MSKSLIFLVKSFLGNFYRNLAIFFGHSVSDEKIIAYERKFAYFFIQTLLIVHT